MDFFAQQEVANQEILHPLLSQAEVTLHLKREDQLHPLVSGNKFRKLKYNLIKAKELGYTKVLTFGGAYSNHIVATAAAGQRTGFETIGVIRGDELGKDLQNTLAQNSTLRNAYEYGMQFDFIDRTAYREKMQPHILSALKEKHGDCFVIPEGGTNELAVRGCEEIITARDKDFDTVCIALGTGGSMAGVINGSYAHQEIVGFPALKGDFLMEELKTYTAKENWKLITDYHFGGYAKVNKELVDFINTFKKEQKIPLDPIYTGKMIFGVFDLVKNGFFRKNTRILAVHTGGLQGIHGMNKNLHKKNLPLIEI